MIFPASVWTSAKHPAFSKVTNHLAGTNKTKYNYKYEKQKI